MKLAFVMLALTLAAAGRAQGPALPEAYAQGMRHLEQAARYSEQNREVEAIWELEQAYRLLPASPQLCELLGEAYLKSNDGRAVELLRKAAEMYPSDERWEKLFDAFAANRRHSEAVRVFAARVQAQPGSARMHLLLGEACWNTGEYGKALAAFQRSAELDPSSARAHFRAGYAQQFLGDSDAAKQSLVRALQLDPEMPLANLAMGHLLAAEGHWQEAIPLLEKYARARPDDLDVRVTLGQIYLEHHQPAEAGMALQEASKLRSDEKRVHYLLGRWYSATGQQDQAAREFARFSELEAAEMEQKRLDRNAPYYSRQP
jgi:tetratricopeptide (TPR) repeat protein